ncbi:hypothetical protein HY628_02120 [Candidatus Uhrbacteria bacterium]|nr:hypothetical protein [Candidatus Uhrbacteria bacterium]
MEDRTQILQVNPDFLIRNAQATSGIAWFVVESARNSLQAGASKVCFDILRGDGGPILKVLDDGTGMREQARLDFGLRYGFSPEKKGNGSGVRQTAVTVAQLLEAQTVPQDEPDVVYCITLPLERFFNEVAQNAWKGKWKRLPRRESNFPGDLAHGTLLMLSDFWVHDLNERTRKHSRVGQVTEANLRNAISSKFIPDLARRLIINGKPFVHKPLDGFLLWLERGEANKSLGRISGEIRLASSGSGNWLIIGGSTATVLFTQFIEDFDVHNPDLARQIPSIFRTERRLIGFLTVETLERHSIPTRQHFLPGFYTSAEALMLVDVLQKIGRKLKERRDEFEGEAHPEEARAIVSEAVERMNAGQGIRPPAVPGGRGDEDQRQKQPPAEAPLPKLKLSHSTCQLEVWNGRGPRDEVTVKVSNPLIGEEFEWSDRGIKSLKETAGGRVTVRAIADKGEYIISVRSLTHPERTAGILVKMLPPSKTEPDKGVKEFRLIPLHAIITVGETKRFRIREPGNTSGFYEWEVKTDEGRRPPRESLDLEELAEGREVEFTPHGHGKFTLICRDARKPHLETTATVEVRAKSRDDDDDDDRPSDDSGGDRGTGDPDRSRPAEGLNRLYFDFEGKQVVVTISVDTAMIDYPFVIGGDVIYVGAKLLNRFVDRETRLRHVVSCIADGLVVILYRRGLFTLDDHSAFAGLHTKILDMVMPAAVSPDEARPTEKKR